MIFKIIYSEIADLQLEELENSPAMEIQAKAVFKTLGLLETNLKHPSLNTHKFDSLIGENGETVFEAYAQNNTPRAYRIFWHYGPDKSVITIVSISPHP
ncbi:MAG: hypothetical protein H7263_09480 [Candidatus Sericytochromatia bacterium]|nr:hypothetical protein [Candidatus Sericytochromatia bacterium]